MLERSVSSSVRARAAVLSWLLAVLALAACGVSGPVSQFTAAVADDVQCRTSSDNTVADMPGTAVAFTRSGTDTASVVVSFVANWPNPSEGEANGAFIFLEIDGQRRDITSTNGGVLASEGHPATVSNGTHGFNFVTEPLAPGGHVATIRWADNVLSGTGTICVAERSIVVFHD
jgi:predicted small lipoprotein YifL